MEKEIIINKEFIWNEDRFRILSLKNTNGKAVVKICKQAEKDQLLAAYEKNASMGCRIWRWLENLPICSSKSGKVSVRCRTTSVELS